jgi:N-acetylmuramoyl-L-alanine amidase
VKPYWLLPSCLSVLACAMPAYAGKITSWRFDTVQNRLSFTTDGGVQPRAQLLSSPTRLVIDLPGTQLGRPTIRQQFRGIFSSLRIGQVDDRNARIVLELQPGYGLNPQGIIFRGASPVQWSVQLPRPQRIAPSFPRSQGNPAPLPPVEPPSEEPQTNIGAPRLIASADGKIPSADESQEIVPTQIAQSDGGIQIQSFQVTRGGFFMRSFGGSPIINLSRSRDRDTINIDIENATFSSNLLGRQININRYGVGQVEFTAIESSPRLARITLKINPKSPNWRAFYSRLGGIVLLPQGQILSDLPNSNRPPIQSSRPLFPNPPTINSSPPTINSSGGISIPVPPPERNSTPIIRQTPTPSTVQLPPPRSGRVRVLIDPGHGGYDSGAPGVGGVLEKHIVLSISRKVSYILRQNGIQVSMTRTGDSFVELPGRVQMVPRVGADVFVSIHANAIGGRPDVRGLEVYYYGPAGERLARTIHRSIVNNVSIPDRGVRRARFYVLRKNSVPATLVEVGFVTNASEAAKLTSDSYQNEMARAIAQGIIQFVR